MKKRVLILALSIILIITIGLLIVVLVILPNNYYNEAIENYKNGNYDNAIELFEKAYSYRDSKEMIVICKYEKGIEAFNNKEYDDAIDVFYEIIEYKDSKDKLIQIEYIKAIELLEQGKTSEAMGTIAYVVNGYGKNNNIILSILTAIATSVVAAFVYWLIIDKLIKRKHNNNLKMLMADNIKRFYFEIYHMFIDLTRFDSNTRPMGYSIYFHSELISGKLCEDEFEYLLKNKCWGGARTANIVSISKELKEHTEYVNELYSSIVRFPDNLSADIIVLIDVIVKRLNSFKLDESLELKDASIIADSYYFIYAVFIELGTKISKLKYIDNTIKGYVLGYYYENSEFRHCKSIARKLKDEVDSKFYIYWLYDILCDYNLGYKERAYRNFDKEVVANKLFIYDSSMLDILLKDDVIIQILLKYFSDDYVKDLSDRINEDLADAEKRRQECKNLSNE